MPQSIERRRLARIRTVRKDLPPAGCDGEDTRMNTGVTIEMTRKYYQYHRFRLKRSMRRAHASCSMRFNSTPPVCN